MKTTDTRIENDDGVLRDRRVRTHVIESQEAIYEEGLPACRVSAASAAVSPSVDDMTSLDV